MVEIGIGYYDTDHVSSPLFAATPPPGRRTMRPAGGTHKAAPTSPLRIGPAVPASRGVFLRDAVLHFEVELTNIQKRFFLIVADVCTSGGQSWQRQSI